MPTIKRKADKTKKIPTSKDKKRREIYNSTTWENMRMAKLMKNPLCEICELEGKTTLATEVHHANSFVDHNEDEMYYFAFDSNNFISVCTSCHSRCHKGDLKGTKSLDDIKQYIEAHKKA